MPNTANVSQALPLFVPAKNGQISTELKTNNNFNQLLKSEVANKAKKTQADATRQQSNSKAVVAPPKPNNTKIENKTATSERNLSVNKEDSEETNAANSASVDSANVLINFVGDINALALRGDYEQPPENASANIDTTLLSTSNSIGVANSNSTSTDADATKVTEPLLDNGFDSNLIKTAQENADMSAQTTSLKVPIDQVPEQRKLSEDQSRFVAQQLQTEAVDKSNKTINDADQQINIEKVIGFDNGIELNQKPPSLNAENQIVDAQATALKTVQLATAPNDNRTAKNTSGEVSAKALDAESTTTDDGIGLNANDRTASDKFSMDLKAQAREAKQSDIDQNSQNKQEFKLVDVPSAASVTPAPQLQASIEANAVSATSNFIGPRVGTKMWDQAIGQKIVWMVAGGEQSAQLTLNPPDLGPVQVVLSISDNQVDASFVSSHLDVREAIEAAAPKLREMMDNAGLSLAGFSVNSQSSASSNSFASDGENRNSGAANNSNRKTGIDTSQDAVTNSLAANDKQNRAKGLVDTFV